MRPLISFDYITIDLDLAHDPIIVRNRTEYAYTPYCMRCTAFVRMYEVSPFLWQHHCGAVHDETQVIVKEQP